MPLPDPSLVTDSLGHAPRGGGEMPRVPRRLGTRLACFGLFVLAFSLAGAASSAVQGMARPRAYEPCFVSQGGACTPTIPVVEPPVIDQPCLVDAPSAELRAPLGDQPPPPPRPVPITPPLPKKPPATSKTSSLKSNIPPPTPKNQNPAKGKAEAVPDLPLPAAPKVDAQRVSIRDRKGRRVVGRVYGQSGDQFAVILPDGQIGFTDGLVRTDAPFVPATHSEIKSELLGDEYASFRVCERKHYIVLYRGSETFAQASADLLEDLYVSLASALQRRGFATHESEFSLVAVIYATEEEFRARKKVAPEVQAYYEILSNRIFLYEKSARDQHSPEMALLSKPQTIAHEGSHQVLQNIGVQPRLADWPMWLVEGLAEYCSPPRMTKTGVAWAGLNQINPLHMATIRDIDDPLSTYVQGVNTHPIRLDKRGSWIETLVNKGELNATDYALSWALTHYLANKRLPEFLAYLKEMSEKPPMEIQPKGRHLADFLRIFGKNLPKLDATVASYLGRLKKFDSLPYYAVTYEQPLPNGTVYRASMVSQSPSIISQWLEGLGQPRGGAPQWRIEPHLSKARAILSVQEWMGR